MNVSPDILIVIATVVTIFAVSSSVAGWAERRWPWMALASLAIALGLFGFVHLSTPGGLTLVSIPNSFVRVAAMILN